KAPSPSGFRPYAGEFRPQALYEEQPPAQGAPVPDWFGHNLQAFCAEVKLSGARLVLVESPTWQRTWPGQPGAELDEVFTHAQAPLVRLGLREVPELRDALYFADAFHLNREGAEIFCERLLPVLAGKPVR
ncbi:unnamed protein product, partial [Phaeothamnion confervicola]